jgi:hypothetical protein
MALAVLCTGTCGFPTGLPEAVNPRQAAWPCDETPPSCSVETHLDHTQTPELGIVRHDRVQLQIFGSLQQVSSTLANVAELSLSIYRWT